MPRGIKRTVPLFIVCQRPGCGKLKEVRRPVEQRAQKFCSRRCAAMVVQNIRGAGRQGGLVRAHRRRLATLERLKNLTPLEAFRLGYVRGLQSKWRQTSRHRKAVA